MQPIFESFPGIIEVRHGPLARYGNNQETLSRRPEQMYTSTDTRLEWLGDGPLFESDSNKRQGAQNEATIRVTSQAIIKVRPVVLVQYGTNQTISGRLELVYLPSDPRLEWPVEGPSFWAQNVCTIRGMPGPLFMSGLGFLAR